MVKIFSLGINSNKYWYFLYSSLFYAIRSFTFKEFLNNERNERNAHFIMKCFLMGLGMTLSLIFEIISRKLQSGQIINKSPIHNFYSAKIKMINISVMAFAGLLDTIGTMTYYYEMKEEDETFFYGEDQVQALIQFILVSIMSGIFLKLRLQKHHYFFSVFMLLGIIALLIANINNFKVNYHFWFSLVWSFSHSVLLIINKWLLDYRFKSVFEISGLEGAFIIAYSIIGAIIYGIVNGGFTEIIKGIDSGWFYLHASFYIVTTLGHNIFLLVITKYFGPTNRIVTDLFAYFILFIINVIFNAKSKLKSLTIALFLGISQVLLFIGSIGFNEILIVHFCGLEENTKKIILSRSGLDELIEDIQFVENRKLTVSSEMQKVGISMTEAI